MSALDVLDNESRSSVNISPETEPFCSRGCMGACSCIYIPNGKSDRDDQSFAEMFEPQEIMVDFTPSALLDTPVNVDRCLAIWDTLLKSPKWAVVLNNSGMTNQKDLSLSKSSSEGTTDVGRTAVSILNIIDDAGITKSAFETKNDAAVCSPRGSLHRIPENPEKSKKHASATAKTEVSAKLKPEKPVFKTMPDPIDVKEMLNEMDNWDNIHPKSMEAPGHPPISESMKKQFYAKTYSPCDGRCVDCGCHQLPSKPGQTNQASSE